MKIVLITKANENPYNSRINIDFLKKLSPMCEEFTVVKGFDKKKKKLLVKSKDIYEKYKPDVIMCHAQHPLLNGFFKNIPCMKAVVSVDFHKLVKKNDFSFYKTNDFDLVINRGFISEKHKEHLRAPSIWLPWSADEKIFFPSDKRENKIGFIGSKGTKSYEIRNKAIEKLSKSGILRVHNKSYENYPKILRSYKCILSSSEMDLAHAKLFEIMASGTVALVSPFIGSNILFNSKCYVEYKKDASNIVNRATKILKDNKLFNVISINARNEILEKHTDNIRIRELYFILNSYLKGDV